MEHKPTESRQPYIALKLTRYGNHLHLARMSKPLDTGVSVQFSSGVDDTSAAKPANP